MEIEAEFAETITGLRLAPRTGPVSCELWLYSRYGTLRHFRVGDAGLMEVDLYGTPLDLVKPIEAGAPLANETPAPQGVTPHGPSAPGPADYRGPILRWLAKRNAARVAGTSVDGVESSELRTILGAGGPDGKTKRAAGKKPVRKKPEAAGPADPGKNPGPEQGVPCDPPALPANTLPAENEPIPGGIFTSREGGVS